MFFWVLIPPVWAEETAPASGTAASDIPKKDLASDLPAEQSDGDSATQPDAETATTADAENPENPEGETAEAGFDLEKFDKGYAYFAKDDFEDAAPLLYEFVAANKPVMDEYDWAEFFLGVSLYKQGFTHASVDVLSWLVTRKPNTQIVSYILELFEDISRSQPYDREKVILRSVCDQEYGFIEGKLKDFIHFHQGLFDWVNGFDEWGDHHFSKITPNSYYHYKFKYQRALYSIARDDIDTAIPILHEINQAEFDGEDLKNQVRKTLARLLYEKGEYELSDKLYQSISHNIIYQAQNLMERSWDQYRIGKQEKAMGLLYAFKAPVYRNYFTPEYFLLKSFIYKGVCHYQRALAVIDEFREHYRDAMDIVYTRKDLTDNKVLLLSLLGHTKIADQWNFLRLLDKEREKIEDVDNPALKAFLENIYAMKIEQMKKEFKLLVEDKYEVLANELLEYEEKTDLMAYEIGLDMYQRVYQYHYDEKKEKKTKPLGAKHYMALYPFQGEFWNDELNAYKVTLKDKCDCLEEWDIFFK